MNSDAVKHFLHECHGELLTGKTTEHSYRPFYKELFNHLDGIVAINEPTRSENGNPDFVFLHAKNQDVILGYAEMKDIDKNLDEVEKSEQMDRYKGYKNLFLTNNLDWRFFRNGEKYFEIQIAKYDKKTKTITEIYENNFQQLTNEVLAFFEQTPESIKSGKRLAEIMGAKARRIRDNVEDIIEKDSDSEIENVFQMMKEMLVSDLTKEKFADMYAQTLVYGLFVARYSDDTPNTFTRAEARDLVPPTNPFLREFFDHIAGPHFSKRLGYIVDELCEIFSVSDIKEIVHKHLKITTDDKLETRDPIIHFYEDFLANYDPALRKSMGAYYTPTPVVRYIVRMVDKVLKEDFKLKDGIATNEKIKYTRKVDPYSTSFRKNAKIKTEEKVEIPKVQILDPAVGTATFLNETIKYIYNEKFQNQKGAWTNYVNENILPRLNGFELMMAPYTISHLKLGMTLSELGCTKMNSRLRVFLTNTLTEGIEKDLPLFALLGLTKAVAEESALAAEVKNDLPVMVVMGNPPYSGVSSNETEFANRLIEKYKVEPGGSQKLQERKHWLNDDYVKFIAFAEEMVNKNNAGIVAMITNHGYLDNPTFRGMRWRLLKTFDKIYVLDLHGNAKKKETAPDGSKDENVFDIMQGVAIIIGVKTRMKLNLGKVYHAEIYGTRKYKFAELDADKPRFQKVKLDDKMFYFVPKNDDGREEYEKGISLNELMPVNTTGIVTMGDEFIVSENKKDIYDRIQKLTQNFWSKEDLKNEFHLGKNYADFVLSNAKQLDFKDDLVVPLAYRPFDKRYTYFDNKVIWRWREKVMRNFLDDSADRERERERNLAMIFKRGLNEENSAPIFCVDCISESRSWSRPGMEGIEFNAPLYVLQDDKNTSLATCRQQKSNDGFHHILVSDNMIESSYVSNKTSEITNQLPLYIKENTLNSGRRANFDEEKLKELFSEVEQPNEKSRKVYPEDIFDYIYASLHSPSYRDKYKEFLKTDFPRVPRPKNWKDFWRLVELGRELRNLHLMDADVDIETTYPESGSDIVEKVEYKDGKVYINSTQYFGNVPELAWNFFIGGYQPAQKWLKDRKSRKLSLNDIDHYQKIIAILLRTDNLMKKIG